MTQEEAVERTTEARKKADRSMYLHNLAMSAFNVAVARHDWTLAETEQQQALAHLSSYMDSVAAVYRIAQEMEN